MATTGRRWMAEGHSGQNEWKARICGGFGPEQDHQRPSADWISAEVEGERARADQERGKTSHSLQARGAFRLHGQHVWPRRSLARRRSIGKSQTPYREPSPSPLPGLQARVECKGRLRVSGWEQKHEGTTGQLGDHPLGMRLRSPTPGWLWAVAKRQILIWWCLELVRWRVSFPIGPFIHHDRGRCFNILPIEAAQI